jgi:hypothetical protein
MMSKFAMSLPLAGVLGLWACAQADILPEIAAAPGVPGSQSCGIEIEETGDGLLLTGWAVPYEAGSWRMVVYQSTGGGGFDIVQEGDLRPSNQAYVPLSDMLIDSGSEFSARLTTWNAAGEPTCRYGGRV